jgi:glycosyltransferase involved in cell wall biosynthesis
VLGEALQDVGEQQRRGANAQEYALKNYSWDAIALAIIQAYRHILVGAGKGKVPETNL